MMARAVLASVSSLAVFTACAAYGRSAPEPISIEFGQDRYLSDAYLATTPGSRCGPPAYAPGGVEASAPLPDGSWFRVVTIGESSDAPDFVVLERGTDVDPRLTLRLDGEEGIVRLRDDSGRVDAWGIHHPWADWLRALGRRTRSLGCAAGPA